MHHEMKHLGSAQGYARIDVRKGPTMAGFRMHMACVVRMAGQNACIWAKDTSDPGVVCLLAGVTKFLKPSVAGFLLQKELDYLDGAVANPKRPFVAIIGGSKVSSKIGVIEKLIEKVDKIILGCAVPPAPLRGPRERGPKP